MTEKNFTELRKKLLADLFVKQSEELKNLGRLHIQGLLKDSTEFYKMRRKVQETKAKIKELTGSEPLEPAGA